MFATFLFFGTATPFHFRRISNYFLVSPATLLSRSFSRQSRICWSEALRLAWYSTRVFVSFFLPLLGLLDPPVDLYHI
jgi:hypothetical protein